MSDFLSTYYNTNAIYEYLENNNVTGFLFAKGSLWLLLYGDKMCTPKMLIAASSANLEDYHNMTFSEHEKDIFNIGEQLANKAGLPFGIIRFCSDLKEIDFVQCLNWSTKKYKIVSIDKLREVFEKHGIHTKSNQTQKPVNDKPSSAFHNWQRDTLGDEIVATDLDLLRIDTNGNLIDIYELKRAETPPFDEWEPFKRDYPNFKLVSKFSEMVGINFYILFNRRTKKPFCDDISKLKLFTFDHNNEGNSTFVKTLTLEEFIGGI